MKFVSNVRAKKHRDIEPGELVRITSEKGILAIALSGAAETLECVALEPNHTNLRVPGKATITVGGPILSYGHDWILEVVENDVASFSPLDHQETIGALRLGDKFHLLQIAPNTTVQSSRHLWDINLETWKIEKDGADYLSMLPVTRWRIWANDEHRKRDNAVPLLNFDAVEKAAP